MPVALFIAGNFWLAAALTFGFGSSVVSVDKMGEPQTYKFLGTVHSISPNIYYSGLVIVRAAAVICFVLSYVAWRRQHHPPMRSTGAAGAFLVILASDESGPDH